MNKNDALDRMNTHINSIGIIHDWLVTFGGSEIITSALMEIWPDAQIFTLIHDPNGQCRDITLGRQINTSFIQHLPFAKRNHRFYLPLMPLAVEQFDTSNQDIVISCSHAVAHGVITQPEQLHINYICIPMRYAWHLYHQYLEESGMRTGLKGMFVKLFLHYLRLWDTVSSYRVDEFVAISNWTANNVWKAYRRKSQVIYPPVDVEAFSPQKEKEGFYLTVSRLVPYKRVDLIVNAFNQMPSRKLIIIGDGPDLEKLRNKAGKNIEFLGFQPFESVREYLQGARAFVYAAVEDFGIVPVEAQACGTPVIAYGRGGVLETVVNGKTGLFYSEPTVESLQNAIAQFETGQLDFDVIELRGQSERFNKQRFQSEFKEFVEKKWNDFDRS